jgi:ectoine hydroxylase-related dioxygenase (phytanoyl-CoA dioxygenase family)
MSLTQEQVKSFREKGFIVIKGFFGPDETPKISAWLDSLRDRQPAEGQEAKYYETSPINGKTILVRIENVIGDYNREASDLLISGKAKEALTQLLGEAPVLFKDKVNYKLPGCRADKLHQDQAAGWNAYCDSFITMAVAVDENRLDNGALSFMSSGNYEKTLDVIFFDAYVPHGSPPNTGTRSRRNIFLTFNKESDGDMRAAYYRDKWANYAPNQADEARKDESFRV